MSFKLKDNLNSKYFEAANALTSKKARHRIVAYVESYDDIYFWRTVLSEFENDKRYFEVMLPSKINLTRGKKSVLMNFLEGEPLGKDMIACVDADYDYLIQGRTHQSKRVLESPYVFHTYVYAIENYQCYAPSLHNVCVSVTLNDHRIFDFRGYFQAFSEVLFPLFVWSIMVYRNGNYPKFSISDFNRIADPGGFNVQNPERSIANVKRKVHTKINDLQRQFPEAKEEYLRPPICIYKVIICLTPLYHPYCRRCVTCFVRSARTRFTMLRPIRRRSEMKCPAMKTHCRTSR